MVMSIEEQMNTAQVAPEPAVGNLESGDVGAMSLKELTSAGWVYVWNTKTGDRSICNRNMLRKQLKKRHPDGTPAFTTSEPSIKPYRGTFKCLLHPDGENRAHYDEIGLPVCRKSNITSKHMVERHMQKRHKMEWEVIKAEKAEREKQEDREFQKGILNMMKGRVSPLPIEEMEYEQLIELGKTYGITSRMKKGELIAAIKEAQDADTKDGGTE